jgi:hypothetical protein
MTQKNLHERVIYIFAYKSIKVIALFQKIIWLKHPWMKGIRLFYSNAKVVI